MPSLSSSAHHSSATKAAPIYDPVMLSAEENQLVRAFFDRCEAVAQATGFEVNWSVAAIADDINLYLSDFHKEGIFIQAIWVTFFQVMREHLPLSAFKYGDLETFHEAYRGQFVDLDELEQEYLWKTANWMSILFKMIPAKKNKGLAMQIVPKLVEGWNTKYVTGSGQTRATANRVHIFETEGETHANHRGRAKSRKPSHSSYHNSSSNDLMAESSSSGSGAHTTISRRRQRTSNASNKDALTKSLQKKRKYSDADMMDDEASVASLDFSSARTETTSSSSRRSAPSSSHRSIEVPEAIYLHPINASKYKSHLASLSAQVDSARTGCDSEGTDAEHESTADEEEDEEEDDDGHDESNSTFKEKAHGQSIVKKSPDGAARKSRNRVRYNNASSVSVPMSESCGAACQAGAAEAMNGFLFEPDLFTDCLTLFRDSSLESSSLLHGNVSSYPLSSTKPVSVDYSSGGGYAPIPMPPRSYVQPQLQQSQQQWNQQMNIDMFIRTFDALDNPNTMLSAQQMQQQSDWWDMMTLYNQQ